MDVSLTSDSQETKTLDEKPDRGNLQVHSCRSINWDEIEQRSNHELEMKGVIVQRWENSRWDSK